MTSPSGGIAMAERGAHALISNFESLGFTAMDTCFPLATTNLPEPLHGSKTNHRKTYVLCQFVPLPCSKHGQIIMPTDLSSAHTHVLPVCAHSFGSEVRYHRDSAKSLRESMVFYKGDPAGVCRVLSGFHGDLTGRVL